MMSVRCDSILHTDSQQPRFNNSQLVSPLRCEWRDREKNASTILRLILIKDLILKSIFVTAIKIIEHVKATAAMPASEGEAVI